MRKLKPGNAIIGWFEWRRLLIAGFGIALGLVTFYFATRNVSSEETEVAFRRLNLPWLAFAILVYALSLLMRALRWWILLAQLSRQRLGIVPEATIVGFAANYLLPAKLGELFRADYIKRISGLSGTAAIGSIAVERTLDGLTVITLLAFGALLIGKRSGGRSDRCKLHCDSRCHDL